MTLADSTCVIGVDEVSGLSSLQCWQLPDTVILEQTLHCDASTASSCWQQPLSLAVECCVFSHKLPIGWAVRRFYASYQHSSKWHRATRKGSYSASTSGFLCQEHSTIAPYSCSSTCSSYRKDKWVKPGNSQKALPFRKSGRVG